MVVLAAIEENERSERVATIAHDLALTYDDTLAALHVIPTEDYEAYREAIMEIPEFREFSIEQEVESAREYARTYVERAVDDVEPGIIEAHGRVGDVSTEILNVAAELEPRFLVISGRRRSPVGKALFGSTAQKILLNADCPVVTSLSDD